MASQSSITMRLSYIFRSAHETLESNLCPLWRGLFGENEDTVELRLKFIEENVTALVKDIVQAEVENNEEHLKTYEELLRESESLGRELSIHVPRRNANEPLCFRIMNLEDDLVEHRRVRNDRMVELENYQKEEREICAKLEEPCTYADLKSVPSEAKLGEIQKHIETLNATLKSRQVQYHTLRNQVMNLWETLEIEPEGDFEHQIKSNNNLEHLGAENLEKLEALVSKLEDTKTKMHQEIEELRYKLSTVWTRLNIDSREREAFLTTNSRCCASSIAAFREQIKVCTALKLTRIKEIIGAIRDELQDWWEKAHFGQEQRDQFVEFKLKYDITGEVLEKHEKEVENVKEYFEQNRELIESLKIRFLMWEELKRLQEMANHKDRLFSNRGGQLLLEEKQRKEIQKELPKLDRKLDKLFDAYEARCGHAFLFDGEDAREMIAKQWETRNKTKENVKQAKKYVVGGTNFSSTAKSILLYPTGGPGQTPKLLHPAGQTPHRIVTLKRRAEYSPMLDPKRRLLNCATKTALGRRNGKLTVTRKPQAGGLSPSHTASSSYIDFMSKITIQKRSSSLSDISRLAKSQKNQMNENVALNSTRHNQNATRSVKPPRSTPIVQSLPIESKLLFPKIRTNLRDPGTPAAHGGSTFCRPRLYRTPHTNGLLTMSRSNSVAQLTRAAPKI